MKFSISLLIYVAECKMTECEKLVYVDVYLYCKNKIRYFSLARRHIIQYTCSEKTRILSITHRMCQGIEYSLLK